MEGDVLDLREYDRSRSSCRYHSVAEEIGCGISFQSQPLSLDHSLSIDPVCPISAAEYSGIITTERDAHEVIGLETPKTAAIVAIDHGMISPAPINLKLAECDAARFAVILPRSKDSSMPTASLYARHAWTETLQEPMSAGLTVEVGRHADL